MFLKISKLVTDLPGIWALVVVSYADLLPFVAGTLAIILSIIRIGQSLGWRRRPSHKAHEEEDKLNKARRN